MTKNMLPRLYYAPGACSLAALVAFYEAEAGFEGVPVLLANGEQNQPEYRSVNPHGRVPALIVEGQVITELIAVLTWIARSHPNVSLLPFDDVILLARAYERMSWYATSLHVAIAQCWRTERFTADQQAWPAIQQGGRATIEKGFQEIEALFDGPWILGERYSVLDAYTHAFWRWGERLGLAMIEYPRWAEQRGRLLARPAVERALAAERAASEVRTGARE